MRRILFATVVVFTLAGCGSSGDDTTGSTTTQPSTSPPTELACVPGSETSGLDSSPVEVIVTSAPIAAGTSVEEAIAANALAVSEICASFAPQGAATSLESLDPTATAIVDLEPNTVVTNQFG